jgi:hypothetical protein
MIRQSVGGLATRSCALLIEPIDAAFIPSIMRARGKDRWESWVWPGLHGGGGMIETLTVLVNDDQALVRRGRYLTTTLLLEVGESAWLISIFEGRIASVTPGPFVMPSWSFALRAPGEEWQKFWSRRPPPGSNDLMALIKRRVLKVEGDLGIFMANLRYFKEALAKLRAGGAAA